MENKIQLKEIQCGFEWGAAKVQRLCDDEKRGWVILQVQSPKKEIQIYVTRTGKIRVHNKHGEWMLRKKIARK